MVFDWKIIGHNKVIDFLQNSLQRNQLSHAYIFYGDRHLGKKTIARFFTKSIICEGGSTNQDTPCQECVACKQFDISSHPDVLIVRREKKDKTGKLNKNINIKQIRDVKRFVSLSSLLKKKKIIIIEQADKLNNNAANSLLKVLEESTRNCIFILTTSKISNIPKTVVSRCQKIKFLPVCFDEIYDYLKNTKEIQRDVSVNIASLSQGRPGVACKFSQNDYYKSYCEIIKNDFFIFNSSKYKKIEFINSLFNNISGTEESKNIAIDVLLRWNNIIRDLFILKNCSIDAGYKTRNSFLFLKEEFKNEAVKHSSEKYISLLDNIKKSYKYLDNNINPKLILENIILSF